MNCDCRSRRLLEWAAWLAGEYQAELGIVHVAANADPTAFGIYFGEAFQHYAREQAEWNVATLQAQADTAAKAFIKSGDPAKVVAATCREFGADLLVAGRRDPTGADGHLLEHLYAILRDSPCPVISL